MPENVFLTQQEMRCLPAMRNIFLSHERDNEHRYEPLRGCFFEDTGKGYLLFPTDNSADNFCDTIELLRSLVSLLTESSVYFALKNTIGRSSNMPTYLHWLSVNVTTEKLSVKSVPTYDSLEKTILLASKRKVSIAKMQAELILYAPRPLNDNQLNLVKRLFGDAARHHFTYMTESGKVKRFTGLDYFSTITMHIVEVASDQPYVVMLKDGNAKERLYWQNIQHLMQPLESSSHPASNSFRNSQCLPEDGALALDILGSGFNKDIRLHFSQFQSIGDILYAQMHYFPKTLGKIMHPDTGMACFKGRQVDTVLFFAEHEPSLLCSFTQKEFADWFLAAGIDKLNTFTQILLSKARAGMPYTLPATQDLISEIRTVMYYLLASSQEASNSLKAIVRDDTYKAYVNVRKSMSQEDKDKVKLLYSFCVYLTNAQEIHLVRNGLKEHFNIPLSSTYDIAYAPEEVVCVINISLNLISELFCKYLLYDKSLNSEASNCHDAVLAKINEASASDCYESDLANSNVLDMANGRSLLLFIHQSFFTMEHKKRSWPLPIACVEFSLERYSDRVVGGLLPTQFWVKDYFIRAYINDSALTADWIAVMHEERKFLLKYTEAVSTHLQATDSNYTLLKITVSSVDLLKVFNALQTLLFCDSSNFSYGTNTRVRVLPSVCDRSYLEKKSAFFVGEKDIYRDDVDTSGAEPGLFADEEGIVADNNEDFEEDDEIKLRRASKLRLFPEFKHFSTDLKALLPVGTNGSVPYLMACLLFDATLKQAQRDAGKEKSVNLNVILQAFQKTLTTQDYYIPLFEKNWDLLIKKHILPKEFSRIQDSAERIRVLCLPNIQERLFYAMIDWDLEKAARQGGAA